MFSHPSSITYEQQGVITITSGATHLASNSVVKTIKSQCHALAFYFCLIYIKKAFNDLGYDNLRITACFLNYIL